MGFLIREDLYFIALATYRIFGNTIRRKLLPIFRISKINHKIYEYPLCLQINKNLPRLLSINDIQKQNRETVNKAAKLINKGHAVIIFPGGGAGKKLPDSLWKIGLGYLVKMIKNRKTQIVYVNIKGTKMRDITGFFTPLLSKVLFRPPEIHIHILNKFNLVKLINSKMSEKEIVRKLERKYLSLLN